MNKLCFLQHRARLKIASRVEKEGETNRRRWWKNCGHKYGMTVCVVKDVELRLVMNCLLYIKIKFPFSLWVSSNFDQDILFLKKKNVLSVACFGIGAMDAQDLYRMRYIWRWTSKGPNKHGLEKYPKGYKVPRDDKQVRQFKWSWKHEHKH